MNLNQWLERGGIRDPICAPAAKWLDARPESSPEALWAECERGSWLTWAARRLGFWDESDAAWFVFENAREAARKLYDLDKREGRPALTLYDERIAAAERDLAVGIRRAIPWTEIARALDAWQERRDRS